MKVSFASQFKKTLSELLISNGFSLLKSRYPYFVRITDDGIIQSISFEKKKYAFNGQPILHSKDLDCLGFEEKRDPNADYEEFMLWIGLSLITQPMTDYNTKPNTLDNQAWMMPYIDFVHRCSLSLDGFVKPDTNISYPYKKDDPAEMVNVLQAATREQLPFIIHFFGRYATIDDLYQLKEHMRFGFYEDIVILKQKVDEYAEERRTAFSKEYEELVSVLENNNNPMMRPLAERKKKEALEKHNRSIQWLLDRKIGGAAYEEDMNNANDRKAKNIRLLAEFGIRQGDGSFV